MRLGPLVNIEQLNFWPKLIALPNSTSSKGYQQISLNFFILSYNLSINFACNSKQQRALSQVKHKTFTSLLQLFLFLCLSLILKKFFCLHLCILLRSRNISHAHPQRTEASWTSDLPCIWYHFSKPLR